MHLLVHPVARLVSQLSAVQAAAYIGEGLGDVLRQQHGALVLLLARGLVAQLAPHRKRHLLLALGNPATEGAQLLMPPSQLPRGPLQKARLALAHQAEPESCCRQLHMISSLTELLQCIALSKPSDHAGHPGSCCCCCCGTYCMASPMTVLKNLSPAKAMNRNLQPSTSVSPNCWRSLNQVFSPQLLHLCEQQQSFMHWLRSNHLSLRLHFALILQQLIDRRLLPHLYQVHCMVVV